MMKIVIMVIERDYFLLVGKVLLYHYGPARHFDFTFASLGSHQPGHFATGVQLLQTHTQLNSVALAQSERPNRPKIVL